MQVDPKELIERFERASVARLTSAGKPPSSNSTGQPMPVAGLRDQVRSRPFVWVAGAAAAGLGLTLLTRRSGVSTTAVAGATVVARASKLLAYTRTAGFLRDWVTAGSDEAPAPDGPGSE